MTKIVSVFMAVSFVLIHLQTVKAASVAVTNASEFVIEYYIENNEELARSYLDENVTIPEVRENTPINRVTSYPSPDENVSVVISYFEDERISRRSGRIAFIWELTVEGEKITDIRVVYDGANPFINESNLINQFESQSKTNILIAREHPFEVNQIDGNVDNGRLELNYRNTETEALLQITVEPNATELEDVQVNNDQIYTLSNGLKALYKPDSDQFLLQDNNLLYSIHIEVDEDEEQIFEAGDYLKIANSMNYD